MTSRRLRGASLRLFAGAVVAGALLPTAALGSGGVRLSVNGEPGPRVAPETLSANIDIPRDTQATSRDDSGRQTTDSHGGTSAKKLLTLAGLDPDHVDTLTIARPNTSGSVQIDHDEIVNGFQGDPLGTRFAAFDSMVNLNTEVHFFRPMRNGGDANRADTLDPPKGQDLAAAAATDGPTLTISASATPSTTKAGQPVAFSASGGGNGVTYTWSFGDDSSPQQGGSVTHAFSADGSYDAAVTAVRGDGGSGAAQTRVQVGTTSGGGNSQTGAQPGRGTGGRGGGGGTNAPNGGGTGKRTAPSNGPKHGSASPGRGTGSGSGSTPSSPPSGATAAGSTSSSAPAGRGTTATRQGKTARDLPAGHLIPVSGQLLASTGPGLDAATRAALAKAGSTPAARASASPGRSLGWWLAAGAGVAALLGLGAGREAGVPLTGRLRAR